LEDWRIKLLGWIKANLSSTDHQPQLDVPTMADFVKPQYW
jgi:hypothetical protein